MTDTDEIREYCRGLAGRLAGKPSGSQIHAAYLDLATVTGQLQAAVAECVRLRGESDETHEIRQALDEMKAQVRKVGLDIRLASESALLIGLQTALESALETLDRLAQLGC